MNEDREQALLLVRLRWPRPQAVLPGLHDAREKRIWMSTLPQEFLLKEDYLYDEGTWSTLSNFVSVKTVERRLVDWVMRNPNRI